MGPFDRVLREFLDGFYMASAAGRSCAIEDLPDLIDPVHDAYLAAVAEHLARRSRMTPLAWTDDHGFELTRPYFAGGLESLKAILTAESPTAFRRRLLFVTADALDRTSMSQAL